VKNLKLTEKRLAWIFCSFVCAVFLFHWYWTDAQSVVELQPHGKTILYRAGFFHREKFDLVIWQGKWQFSGTLGIGGDFLVPFECSYNEHRLLRLEEHGKVYLIDKKSLSRQELKIVNGEWSYDATDHWQSIFDLDY
jgi:hypothetical protein